MQDPAAEGSQERMARGLALRRKAEPDSKDVRGGGAPRLKAPARGDRAADRPRPPAGQASRAHRAGDPEPRGGAEVSSIRIPEHIARIEPYVPGKPIEEVERDLGLVG